MIPNTYIAFILFVTLVISHFITKRYGAKGCASYGYVSLVLLFINLFYLFSWTFMISAIKDVHSVTTSGESYTAIVVDYIGEEHYDSEENRHIPIVQFTTNSGELVEGKLSFSTSSVEIGEEYKINYNIESREIITLGLTIVMRFVGGFLFWSMFTTLFLTMILYISGMKNYYAFASKISLNFFLPILMIGFDGMLIYALFYGNEVSIIFAFFLCLFILLLTLAVIEYIKMIFSNTKTNSRQTRWESEWED